jgi:radical SAM superfamily enzyme YgiQ (UPF0313 family)
MRVLLVYTNRNRFMAPPPIGLATLCPPLLSRGHEVRLLDLMFVARPRAALDAALDTFRPDVVGFSIRNLDEQDMAHPTSPLDAIRPLVRTVTARGILTVLGGAAFTTFPERILELMGADYGIAGQAESSLPRLLDSIDGGIDPTIPGLVWRDGDQIRANPPDQPGYAGVRADWSQIDHRRYRRSMFQAAVMLRSGCAHRCSYCDVPAVFGDHFIPRDQESILEDLRCLRDEHGVRMVFLVDGSFNSPVADAKESLEQLVRRRLRLYLSSTFVPVTGEYDDEFFSLYRKAGGLFAVFGIDALSDTMLQSYRKPFTLDDVVRSCELATRHGVRVICTVMFGGPGETDATIDEAVRTIARLPYSILAPGFGIRILPRTHLFEISRSAGLVRDADELLMPRFYLSPDFDAARARARVNDAIRRHGWRMLRMIPAGARMLLARTFGLTL